MKLIHIVYNLQESRDSLKYYRESILQSQISELTTIKNQDLYLVNSIDSLYSYGIRTIYNMMFQLYNEFPNEITDIIFNSNGEYMCIDTLKKLDNNKQLINYIEELKPYKIL